MASTDEIKRLIQRWEKLSEDKGRWHTHWDDLARVMLPRRIGFAQTTVEGDRRTEDNYDSTPMQAARGLANAIGGMLRPEGLPEVQMKAEDDEISETEEAKDWMAQAEETLKAAFNNPKARFRQSSGETDQDLVVFGTAAMFVGESRLKNSLLFQSLHLKDATVFFDEEGSAAGMFRKRRMPLRHLESQFGAERLSEKTREKLQKDPDQKIDILHAVVPRENGDPEALRAKRLPMGDHWIEIDAKHELSEGGFHEFPFVVPRWDTSSGEDYGRSPGMIALPDSDTLQAMGETILIAGQRAADPPLAVPNDGTFDAINTFPGGLAYYDIETATALRGNPFFPIESGTNLPISRDMQLDTREQVWAAFFRNVLNLPTSGPQMTATEVIQRKEEFMREIGPVFGRLETDYTAPMVERAFMIMLRAGAFGPIPEVLQGQNVRFEYDSPVIRIRKQIDAAAARLWVQERIDIATSTQRPEILDLVNFDEESRFSADALGIPKDIINSEDAVEAIREARQEAAEAAQAQAEAQARLEAAKVGSETAQNAAQAEKAAAEATQPQGAQ